MQLFKAAHTTSSYGSDDWFISEGSIHFCVNDGIIARTGLKQSSMQVDCYLEKNWQIGHSVLCNSSSAFREICKCIMCKGNWMRSICSILQHLNQIMKSAQGQWHKGSAGKTYTYFAIIIRAWQVI